MSVSYRFIYALCVLIVIFNSGCAQNFPRPLSLSTPCCSDGLTGPEIFNNTFIKHGGNKLKQLNDLNVSIDGDWKFLITRIQPLVTDHRYRVSSEERILPNAGVYSAYYQGPAGTKKVIRSSNQTRVFYNNEENVDDDVLQSTALTADSFFIFLLGPLSLESFKDNFVRLEDKQENGKRYHRIYTSMKPGIGNSAGDELVLWVDSETHLTYRVHITLEGYRTTLGAHVDVSYDAYEQVGDYIFASVFHERVLGPISIDAHAWRLTGIDINRGLNYQHLNQHPWSSKASAPAKAHIK
ncbi:hypothetical protein [Agarilytica rhodophyticola]|uniref:hypothetical protein n=1 Tax=Agarilytica rhodophyticola TaxID=1737490 RepID=UPI000B3461C3|nr:hypothetical protein [Agarilytica rhodophyticola]